MYEMAWRCDFPGEPAQLQGLRCQMAALLADCRFKDDAIACVVELGSNAIVHTRSGSGVFTVGVWLCGDAARVAVKDAGGPTEPVLKARRHEEMCEGGRGLAIVAALCTRMGVAGDAGGRVVWADISGDGAAGGGRWSPPFQGACARCWGFDVQPAVLVGGGQGGG